MGEFELKVNPSKNRVVLRLAGFFSDDEIKEFVETSLGELDKLKPGMALISDISNFKPASPKGAKELLTAQKILKEKGVDRIIRVAGSNVLGKKQLDRQAKQAGYSTDMASSVEEAEKMLDDSTGGN